MYGRVGVELHVFLTLALDGENRFASRKKIHTPYGFKPCSHVTVQNF
jgi:hypothetical protein